MWIKLISYLSTETLQYTCLTWEHLGATSGAQGLTRLFFHGGPDSHTMLNHTTLLFATNLPRIKRNDNKFALIMAQKSPDNRTNSVKVSSFTAFIHQLLLAWKYCLWLWRFQRPFASVSIIWFWITEELTTSILRPFVKWWKRSTIFLLFSQSIFSFGPRIMWVRFWFLLI